jgi:dTDP-4-amino-4,6-dideoxygalactose transaminase
MEKQIVKFLDLQEINEQYRSDFLKSFNKVIDSGWYIRGNHVDQFEDAYAGFTGYNYCTGVGNGLDAITLSLVALKLKYGWDNFTEIIVPNYTYIATVLAIRAAGLIPVMVDCESKDSFLLNKQQIASVLTKKTRAFIAVNLYGQPVDYSELNEVATDLNLKFIIDEAQSHGARKRGSKSSEFADISCFSFYPGKNLGALGDGGAVCTNNGEINEIIRALGNYGSHEKYRNILPGYNSRLDELHAAFLLNKLPLLDSDNNKRRKVAERYNYGINNPKISFIKQEIEESVYHLFVVLVEDRKGFQKYLTSHGIQTVIHYPIPIHKQQAFKNEYGDLSFPVSEFLHDRVLSLPISPVMSSNEVEYVIKTCNEY